MTKIDVFHNVQPGDVDRDAAAAGYWDGPREEGRVYGEKGFGYGNDSVLNIFLKLCSFFKGQPPLLTEHPSVHICISFRPLMENLNEVHL